MIQIVIAAALGTLFEWYDFLIFGTAATLVFNKLFFPDFIPMAGMLAALMTYAVGFFARPIGGALFGHLADRFGRKPVFLSTTVLMGGSTYMIGFLPTFKEIGPWAAVLLVGLRLLQGIAFGGEWGAAALLILENLENKKYKTFYSSFVQVGFPLGILLATGVFAILSQLPEDAFLFWGWRIPFFLSSVLIFISLYFRMRISETPAFKELCITRTRSASPFRETITKHWRPLLVATGLKLTEVTWSYIITIFTVAYGTTKLGLAKRDLLFAITIAAAINVVAIPFFGFVADKIGKKPLFQTGALVTIFFSFSYFECLQISKFAMIFAICYGLVLGNGMMFSSIAAYLSELFEPQVRATGLSFSNQLAAMIGGGLAPILAGGLAVWFNGTTGVSLLLIGFALITLLATFFAPNT